MITSNLLLAKFIKLYGYRPTEFDRRYLELLEMGRYRILEVPDVQPATCCNCGASRNDGRKYLDTGRHVEWFGAIFFCGLCLREYAEAMGLLDVVKKELEETKATLLTQAELTDKADALQEMILKTFEEVKALYVDVYSSSNNSTPDSSSDVESDKTTTTEPTVIETKSRTTKSATGSGRTNVPSLANLLGG